MYVFNKAISLGTTCVLFSLVFREEKTSPPIESIERVLVSSHIKGMSPHIIFLTNFRYELYLHIYKEKTCE